MALFGRLTLFVKKSFREHQLLRFIVVGGSNTLLGYGVYAALIFAGLSIPAASFVSLCLGIVVGFLAQGKLVFGNAGKYAFIRFSCVWLLIYLTHIFIVISAKNAGLNPYVGGILAVPVVTALSYFLQRNFVFVK